MGPKENITEIKSKKNRLKVSLKIQQQKNQKKNFNNFFFVQLKSIQGNSKTEPSIRKTTPEENQHDSELIVSALMNHRLDRLINQEVFQTCRIGGQSSSASNNSLTNESTSSGFGSCSSTTSSTNEQHKSCLEKLKSMKITKQENRDREKKTKLEFTIYNFQKENFQQKWSSFKKVN